MGGENGGKGQALNTLRLGRCSARNDLKHVPFVLDRLLTSYDRVGTQTLYGLKRVLWAGAQHFMTGSLAGMTSVAATYPLDLIRFVHAYLLLRTSVQPVPYHSAFSIQPIPIPLRLSPFKLHVTGCM